MSAVLFDEEIFLKISLGCQENNNTDTDGA